jgi:hypothetical protein
VTQGHDGMVMTAGETVSCRMNGNWEEAVLEGIPKLYGPVRMNGELLPRVHRSRPRSVL